MPEIASLAAEPNNFRAAVVQLRSGRDKTRNLAAAAELIRAAAADGAQYIQTPENTSLMELDTARLVRELEPESNNSGLAAFSEAARDLNIWLHIGSLGIKLDDGQFANRFLQGSSPHARLRF